MAAGSTGHFRLENGMVLEMDLPLANVYAARVKRGEIVQVNPDGTPYNDDEVEAPVSAPAGPPLTEEERAELEELRARVPELEAELELATKQRDQAATEAGELRDQVAALTPAAPPQEPQPAKPTKPTPTAK